MLWLNMDRQQCPTQVLSLPLLSRTEDGEKRKKEKQVKRRCRKSKTRGTCRFEIGAF